VNIVRNRFSALIIAIDGMCASGKTTLSKRLADVYCDCVVIHIDDYYNCSIGELRWEEIHDRLCELSALHSHVIIEGVYSVKLSLEYDLDYDCIIFIEVDEREQRERIKKRNPDLFNRYINEWIPNENKYFKKFKVKENSDICLI
jgi:dephospho-CoA kinase